MNSTKTAYRYNQENGQFLHEVAAYIDPMESQKSGTDIYILPANSTFLPLPEDIPPYHSAMLSTDLKSWSIVKDYSQTLLWDKKTASPASIGFMESLPKTLTVHKPLEIEEGLVNYFNEDADNWSLIPDLRGKTYYQKLSGEPFVIEDIGPLPDDLTDKEKPDQLHKWDSKKNDWVVDKLLKKEFIITQNTVKKLELKTVAEERIVLLERKEKLKRATSEDLAIRDLLYGFTIDLDDLDLTQENLTFPQIPS